MLLTIVRLLQAQDLASILDGLRSEEVGCPPKDLSLEDPELGGRATELLVATGALESLA